MKKAPPPAPSDVDRLRTPKPPRIEETDTMIILHIDTPGGPFAPAAVALASRPPSAGSRPVLSAPGTAPPAAKITA